MLMVRTSLTRPIYLLFTEPVLLSFAIWISFAWGVLYIRKLPFSLVPVLPRPITFLTATAELEAIPLVFQGVYGFSIGQAGLVFGTQIVGSCIGLGELIPLILPPLSTKTKLSAPCL